MRAGGSALYVARRLWPSGASVWEREDFSRATPLRAGCQTRGEARLVAAGGVPVNNPFARHLVDERDGLFQRGLRGTRVAAVDRRADGLEGAAQARTELAVVLAVL